MRTPRVARRKGSLGLWLTDGPRCAILRSLMGGSAMRTVAGAYAAVAAGRWDEFASLLSPELDWRGLVGEDGVVPRCRGRSTALEMMARGRLAKREVDVSEFVERGNLVLARVASVDADAHCSERFVLAEVIHGEIVRLHAVATEAEGRAALERGTLADDGADS